MLSRPINLAIVDDHALFRKTLISYLTERSKMQVTIQAADVVELLDKLKRNPVDLLLMDLFLPDLNGSDVLRMLRSEYPDLKILILSMSTDMGLISDLLDAGIHGYISKAEEPEELLQAIYAVSDNKIYRNRIFTEALYWNKQNNFKVYPAGPDTILSEREKKVLQLIWDEKSNKEMADELFLGVRSVEKIRQDMKEKVGVKSTVGLLKYAINKKIIGSSRISSNIYR